VTFSLYWEGNHSVHDEWLVCGQDPELLSAKPLQKVLVHYMPTNEPITEQVLHDVASQLGPEWPTVAAALGVTRPRVQVIQRNSMLRSSPPSVVHFEMLMMWAKALPKCADKVYARAGVRVVIFGRCVVILTRIMLCCPFVSSYSTLHPFFLLASSD